jgi:hypothetical protein
MRSSTSESSERVVSTVPFLSLYGTASSSSRESRIPSSFPRRTAKLQLWISFVGKGLPIPEVYAYSYTSENGAGTEYMLMEYVEGTDLSEVWFNLEKKEIDSFMDQLAKLESIMMSISFPAGGSIYYATDLYQLSGSEGIPLHEQIGSISLEEGNEGIPLDEQAKRIPLQKERFCLGPDVSIPLWYGRREQMDSF